MLHEKLKGLKKMIREWHKQRGVWGSEKIETLETNLHEVMARKETNDVGSDIRRERLEILNNLWK